MITDNNCYNDKNKKWRVFKCEGNAETFYSAPADWNVHLLIKTTAVWWCEVWAKYTTFIILQKIQYQEESDIIGSRRGLKKALKARVSKSKEKQSDVMHRVEDTGVTLRQVLTMVSLALLLLLISFAQSNTIKPGRPWSCITEAVGGVVVVRSWDLKPLGSADY